MSQCHPQSVAFLIMCLWQFLGCKTSGCYHTASGTGQLCGIGGIITEEQTFFSFHICTDTNYFLNLTKLYTHHKQTYWNKWPPPNRNEMVTLLWPLPHSMASAEIKAYVSPLYQAGTVLKWTEAMIISVMGVCLQEPGYKFGCECGVYLPHLVRLYVWRSPYLYTGVHRN